MRDAVTLLRAVNSRKGFSQIDTLCLLYQRPARSVRFGAGSTAGYLDTAQKSKESPNVREKDAKGVRLG